MKVYVVTSGEYSDYKIEAIFSTKEKAEECSLWTPRSEIEEYEVDKKDESCKYYYMSMSIDDSPEMTMYLDIQKCICDNRVRNFTYFFEYGLPLFNRITFTRYIKEKDFNKELTIKKYKKVAYDTLAFVKYELSLGATAKEINSILNENEDEDYVS